MEMLTMIGVGLTTASGAVLVSNFLPNNDRKIIETTLYRQGVFYKEKDREHKPKFKRKNVRMWGREFVYTLPYGITSEEVIKVTTALEEALKKEVEIEWNNAIIISVYDKKQPTRIEFNPDIIHDKKGVPLGVDRKGNIFWFDVTKGLPHLLIGGSTGGGKSSILRVMLTTLILKEKPTMFLLDMKGGVEFGLYEGIEGIHLASTLKQGLSMTDKIIKIMDGRYKEMRAAKVTHAKEIGMKPMYVCCDELADLNVKGIRDKEEKGIRNAVKHNLSIIGAKGRASNIFLILSTQSPRSETIDSEVKTHMQNTMGFRVRSTFDSEVVMGKGNYSLSDLERVPGRVIFQGEEDVKLQTYFLEYQDAKKLLSSLYREVQKENEQEGGTDTFILE